MSNSQLNKLISGIKSCTEVTLKISSNIISDFNDEHSFRYELLLINKQVWKIRKAFANNSSAEKTFSNLQMHDY